MPPKKFRPVDIEGIGLVYEVRTTKKQISTSREKEITQSLLHQQGYRCYWCCKSISYEYCHVDHVIPRAKGGSNHRRNLRAACIDCNLMKSDTDPMDFILSLLGATQRLRYRLTPNIGIRGYRLVSAHV